MTIHGICHETERANRVQGPMYWQSAEFAAVGPIVRIRQIHADGTRGQWETIAIAWSPTRYIAATSSELDVRL